MALACLTYKVDIHPLIHCRAEEEVKQASQSMDKQYPTVWTICHGVFISRLQTSVDEHLSLSIIQTRDKSHDHLFRLIGISDANEQKASHLISLSRVIPHRNRPRPCLVCTRRHEK